MKKVIALSLVLAAMMASGSSATAQNELGFTRLNSTGINFIKERMSFVFTKEYGLKKFPITIGPRTMLNYKPADNFLGAFVGAAGNYHFGQHLKIDQTKFDLYGGLTLGMGVYAAWGDYSGFDYTTATQTYLQAGGRYFFGKKVSLYSQINLGLNSNARVVDGNTLEIGVTFRR